jgi:outer membrane cobalamin receptor
MSAELAEYGHHVQVIQGEKILERGYLDVADALNAMVPGLRILSRSRGDYSYYTMNGNSYVLWLLDGVRLNNRLTGSAYIDTISIHMIDRIEVLMGGEGLFYGTEATSGVVNIITKKPTAETSGQFGVSYGTHGTVDVNGHLSGSIGENKFLGFISHDRWDGYQAYREGDYVALKNTHRPNRSFDRTNAGFKYSRDFALQDGATLDVHLQRNEGAFDMAHAFSRKSENERAQNIGIIKWDHNVSSNYSYYIKAFYHSLWTDYTFINPDGTYDADKLKWGYQDWGINFLNSYRFDHGDEILFGFDYQNYWGKDDYEIILANHEEVYAAFVQFRPHFSFWPEWKTAFGLRYNKTGVNKITVWDVSSRMPFADNTLFLRMNAGTSFILPTALELWADDPNMPEFGNPNLKPQKSFSANIGFGGDWKHFDFEVAGFMENFSDRIELGLDDVYNNVSQKTHIIGYTLSGTIRPLDSISLTAALTRQKATENGEEIARDNIPESFASIDFQWRGKIMEHGAGFGVTHNYTGKMERYGYEYGNYGITDVNAFIDINANHRVALQVNNILDVEYDSFIWRRNIPSTGSPAQRHVFGSLGTPLTATVTYSYKF